MLIFEIMFVIGVLSVTFAWLGMFCMMVRHIIEDIMDKNFGMLALELFGTGLWLIVSTLIIYMAIE